MDLAQKLLTLLIAKGKITALQAEEIKLSATNSGQSVEDLLVAKHLVSEDDFLAAKSEIYNIPLVTLTGKGISGELLSLIPEQVARKYKIIPFDLDKNSGKLQVAMINPLDLPLIEFLEQKSGKTIVPTLGKESEILEKINEEYSRGLIVEVSEALKETAAPTVKTGQAGKIGEIIKEAPIAKIVSTVLEYAVKSRASDVHIEPHEANTRVRYRIDGVLHEKLALPRSVHDAVLTRVKIMANMKIDERRLPQDGRFNFKLDTEEVDLRVSTLPVVYGEKVVMRLLRKTGGIPDLPELGLRGTTLKYLQEAVTKPHGIVLMTGPTGSGKTTTLYSILSRLNTPRVNIVTLEDPIEYEIRGINQVQINPQAGLTFASGLRSFLRQDPNIILVGEIRDRETTTLTIQAALTGHLVFSTLHTNNAAGALPRLIDLGAEPFLITSVLNAVAAQRIVRRICTLCKEVYNPSEEVIIDFKSVLGNLYPASTSQATTKDTSLYRGRGCKECNNTGYLGRIGIFEIIIVTGGIAKLILERGAAEAIERKAREEGMISLKQDGYLKVIEGITTIEEILRVSSE